MIEITYEASPTAEAHAEAAREVFFFVEFGLHQ